MKEDTQQKTFICENCGNDHDGTYGSGRFCSKSCRCAFNSKKQKRFPTKEQLSKRKGFGRLAKEGGWRCHKCNLTFRTRSELRQHYKEVKHLSNQGWSKGLTKESNSSVRRMAQNVSRSLRDGYKSGRISFTQERKDHLSKKRREFLQKHPEKHPSRLVCNTKQQMTYPERVVLEWLTKNGFSFISQFPLKYVWSDGTPHMRYVDFYVENFNTLIEVDGPFWHKDKEQIDHDKDECAKKDGFSTLRIDPSKTISDQLNLFFFKAIPEREKPDKV